MEFELSFGVYRYMSDRMTGAHMYKTTSRVTVSISSPSASFENCNIRGTRKLYNWSQETKIKNDQPLKFVKFASHNYNNSGKGK